MIRVSVFKNSHSWSTLAHYILRIGLTEQYRPFYREAFDSSENVLEAIIKIRNRLIDDGYIARVRYADELIDWTDGANQ